MFDDPLIDLALREDAGLGDLTSEAIFSMADDSQGRIVAKEPMVLAGLEVALRVFERCSSDISVECLAGDAQKIIPGETVLRFSGPTIPLLIAERTVLNFMQNLSGIATICRQYADIAIPYGVRIVDTRKTLPGFRSLAKYAVRCGGCHNHRSGLGDHVLIKENHIAAAGSLEAAIERCQARAPHLCKIEVEVVDIAMAGKAIAAGADVLLLDNMSVEEIGDCVTRYKYQAVLEVSGGVTLDTLESYCRTGVDVISVGALTHSVRAADLSMLFDV
ncbi:MAG: carboxylating nicotinate-nucleotide diphosphorylase [Verrucomicrobiota bacterium]